MSDVPPLPRVTAVQVIGDYKLRLTFADGVVGDVAFENEQWTGVFEPFNDPAVFGAVQVDDLFGTVVWPTGQDMAPEPLYEEARAHPVRLSSSAA